MDASVRERWKAEQRELSSRVVACDRDEYVAHPRLVGGLDLSFFPNDPSRACAVLVVVRVADNAVGYEDARVVPLTVPFISGFLAFREAPASVDLIERLRKERPDLMPDVFMYDGNGLMHERRLGAASHVGVVADVPVVGVAKKLHQLPGEGLTHARVDALYRQHAMDTTPASHCALVSSRTGEAVCEMVRGAHSRQPLFVSVGNHVCLETALQLVLSMTTRAKVPEPIRQADLRGRRHVRQIIKREQREREKEKKEEEKEKEKTAGKGTPVKAPTKTPTAPAAAAPSSSV